MLILLKMFRFLFATTLFNVILKKPGSMEKPSVLFTRVKWYKTKWPSKAHWYFHLTARRKDRQGE